MKVKSSSLVKFGVIMLVANLILAGIFWLAKDREHTLMFLVASIVWVVGIFIHARNVEHGD